MTSDHDLPPLAGDTILGTRIDATSYDDVLARIEARPRDRVQRFAFCNVHSVMSARRDPALRAALDAMDVATPDGMPLVWTLRRRGHPDQPRVYGPDLMELALPHGVERGWRHFFFGANDETLDRLQSRAQELAPGVEIVGRIAPPYRPLTPAEDDEVVAQVLASSADVLWVGLGMPKQERWMHRVADRLPGVAVMGVGAAFDLLSGTVPQAPDWLQERGLEWAYRLWREPRRLWRRYLFNNPGFALLVTLETVRRRRTAGEVRR
ncbi:WecB/TagA/CpsF family glycosyltransferase [Egicoccus halophilus]|uniref:UDP-N-acetyl-D-mannosaminuronic acid transferase n=1 Tax=Egicoccus halophilus TaxID=1670830 RepID=A0A8J3A7E4_9ACTN|nr:WecB/TagA/CpsF family glycosyltransferase [Egicoccus halophilus]GGI05394.1 UDP-N-acetyl-D-mannosaminuronic acid transferase [Egicoccus halophilus]